MLSIVEMNYSFCDVVNSDARQLSKIPFAFANCKKMHFSPIISLKQIVKSSNKMTTYLNSWSVLDIKNNKHRFKFISQDGKSIIEINLYSYVYDFYVQNRPSNTT